MKKHEFGIVLIALLFAALMVLSIEVAQKRAKNAGLSEADLKRQLLSKADLDSTHHQVYAKVGERNWEDSVKPDFLEAITWKTVRHTGHIFPSNEDVLDWVEQHPEEARRLLQRAGARFEQGSSPAFQE